MDFEHWRVLRGARFDRSDRQYRRWSRGGAASTDERLGDGGRLASRPARRCPTSSASRCSATSTATFPGYSGLFPKHLNYLTWAINKGHTRNAAAR
jgi:hypothetical protein